MQNKTYKTISLFSGYLGLDIGVSKAIGEGELVGWSDIEPGPLALGSHHAPKARRLGDITKIDWEKYKDIEVMAGGFCCQSLSLAGFRAGLKAGTRSGLWLDYAKGIGIIRPSLVVAENVAGLLSGISVSKEDERMDALRSEALDKAGLCSCEIPDLELPDRFEAPDPKEETSKPLAVVLRGFLHADPERCSPVTCRRCGRRVFEVRGDMVLADDERLSGVHTAPTIRALGRVLGDLANLGYDAVWRGLEAADIGAPHHRLRIFVTAWPRDPKSAREPSNARLRRLAQLPPMRPRGRAWGVWDADRDVWTTGEPDLFGDVDVFMDAWPKSGVMAAGRVYTVPESWLKVPEPAACLVLATPKASDGVKGGPGQAYGNGDAPLPAQAAGIPADGFLYTPKQSDGVFAAPVTSGRPLGRSTFLSTQVRLMDLRGRMDPEKVREHDSRLPTPRANDANGAGVHGDGAPDLRTAAVMLPTPNALYDSLKAGTSEDAVRRRRRGAQLGLADAINLL